MEMRKMESLVGLLSSAAIFAGAAPAAAQTAATINAPAATDAAKDSTDRFDDDIVVTAQKREERLVEVPMSITVLSRETLERSGATQFRDIANAIPGLSYQTLGAGSSQISLRGITTGNDLSATVGIYVDDVPYGSLTTYASGGQTALDVGLFDLDHLEVLRGPQGTLYGSSSMGGLIKYVTRKPDAGDFSGEARVGVADTNRGSLSYNLGGAVNVPLVTDQLAIRLSAYESHDGGYFDNVQLGKKDVNRSDIYGAKADLLFTPTNALSIRITGLFQNIRRDGQATADYVPATGVPSFGDLNQSRFYPEPLNQRFRLVSGTLNYDLGFGALTSITSYQTLWSKNGTDGQRVYLPFLNGPGFNRGYSKFGLQQILDTKRFTQEVRLASKGGGLIEWLVGGIYSNEKSSKLQYAEPFDAAGNLAPNDVLNLLLPSTLTEYAAFANLTIHPVKNFDITGGIRFAHDKQSIEQIASGLLASSRPLRFEIDNEFTYMANARYHFGSNAVAYFRFATGYRVGGPNIVLNSLTTGQPAASPTFGPDQVNSYEVGFKADTRDRAFGTEISLYHLDWKDIQVFGIRNGVGVRANAGRARVNGIEFAMTARPDQNLTFSSAFAYTDARLVDAFPDLGAPAGARLPNVAKYSVTVDGDYVLSSSSWKPSIGASLRYLSDRQAAFAATRYNLPSNVTVDLRAGATFGKVEAQFYVRNLLDERGQFYEVLAGPLAQVAIQQPRTIGLNLTTRF
jgi:outer membrane receptor protein involved in Fe transport